jgi:hypothetical protein
MSSDWGKIFGSFKNWYIHFNIIIYEHRLSSQSKTSEVTQESRQQQPESAEKLHQTGEQSARDSTDTQRPETGILCCRY